MTEPFEKLYHWIEKQEQLTGVDLQQQMAQWRSLFSEAKNAALEQNPVQANMIALLCQQSEAFQELLGTVSSGSDLQQIEALRQKIHQIHLDYLINSAELPEQFIPLVHTQLVKPTGFTSEQLHTFETTIEQMNLPQLAPVKALMRALIEWSQSAQTMLDHLNRIAEQAIQKWTESVDQSLSERQRIDLWARIYDEQFSQAFEQPPVQSAQAKLIDSLSQVQLRWRSLIEQLAQPLGLTTQREIEPIVKTLDQQRRRIRALEREIQQIRDRLDRSER